MEIIGISPSELVVVVLVVLVIFGPHRMPELARHLGRLMRTFRKASDELRRNLEIDEIDLPRPRDFRVDVDDPIEREYKRRFGRGEATAPSGETSEPTAEGQPEAALTSADETQPEGDPLPPAPAPPASDPAAPDSSAPDEPPRP